MSKLGYKIGSAFSTSVDMAKKYSPEILLGGSIGLNGAALIFAGCAGSKYAGAKTEHVEIIAGIHADMENGNITEEEGKKLLRKEYLKHFGKAALIFAPSAITFTAGSVASIGMHRILSLRIEQQAALTALVTKAFADYRQRVKEQIGDEAEKKIADGIVGTKEVVDPVTGEKKVVEVVKPFANEFTIVLTEENWKNWDYNLGCMLTHFSYIEAETKDFFKRRGYIRGVEVCDRLGITLDMLTEEQAKAINLLGCLYDPFDPTLINDRFSFGIADARGNATGRTMEGIRADKPYIAFTLKFDGDIVNGINGDPTKTLYAKDKEGNWKYKRIPSAV